MKNIELFNQMRKSAQELDTLLRRQKADSENMETIAYEAWSIDRQNDEKRKVFHKYCNATKEIERQIARNEPFTSEKWYMTEFLYSDAHAYEVVEVYSFNRMDVRRLKATITDKSKKELHDSFIPGGFLGHFDNELQEWTFETDENNPILTVRRHKDGLYYIARSRTCPFIPQSEPYERFDFNF